MELARSGDLLQRFDEVAALDVESVWNAATVVERRVPIDEFVEEVLVLPDYLDVTMHGAPPLHFRYQEVGLKESGFDRVGGSTDNLIPRPVVMESGWSELRQAV